MRQRLFTPALLAATVSGLVLGTVSAAPPALAASVSTVSLGEVSIAADAGIAGAAATEVGRALRAALTDELAQATHEASPRRPVIVSATLTRVSSERSAAGSKASASISLAIVRADDRVLFAELRGRAIVEESSSNLASVRRIALQRAVERAAARLPEAIHRCD